MQSEYDMRGGVRGKYLERSQEGSNLVLLDPDVAAVFHDFESVNKTLRIVIEPLKGTADPKR
jgi:hypothetical protein